jgi:type I restriction enzyme S subunit
MSELPIGWDTATLSSLTGTDGLMTDGDWVESKDQDPNGEVRLIQLADVGDGVFLDRSNRFLTAAKAKGLRCTFLCPGDLLIARMPDPLGRACIFPGLDRQSVTAVDVCIWRQGKNGVNSRWVMHAVNSPIIRQEIGSLAGGTTRQRISGGNLKQIQLPVPPVAEQHRIVEKLDELLTRARRARNELRRVVALGGVVSEQTRLLDRLEHSLLNKALRGELVAQDPNDEPASVLLEEARMTLGFIRERVRRGRPAKV